MYTPSAAICFETCAEYLGIWYPARVRLSSMCPRRCALAGTTTIKPRRCNDTSEGVREMKLTAQQEKFCLEYVRSGNAAQAYKATYSVTNTGTAKANGSRLLKNPAVQSRIAELQAQIENEKICTAREIQERLSQIARRELYETICLPNGERVQKQTSIRDSCRALELLAKASGMFISKQELEISGNVPVVIRDDI